MRTKKGGQLQKDSYQCWSDPFCFIVSYYVYFNDFCTYFMINILVRRTYGDRGLELKVSR